MREGENGDIILGYVLVMELGTWCKMNHAITNKKYVCVCVCVCK